MRTEPSIALTVVLMSIAPALFAAGDATRGQALYESRCTACHSVDQNRVGPAHQGVLGRRAGRATDYDFSRAVRTSKIVWSEVTLDQWLTNPERLIPGQKMGYAVDQAADRADLIAYLKKVSPP